MRFVVRGIVPWIVVMDYLIPGVACSLVFSV